MQGEARVLRARIAADAHDCGAWLALAALQDACGALRRVGPQNRVAVLQSALAANPHTESLVLAFFRAATAAWPRAHVAAVWARVLAHQGAPDAPRMTPRLWAAYLAACAQDSEGGVAALRAGFGAAIAGCGAGAQHELGAVAVLVRRWLCARQSGRAERALALVQAAVEAAVWAPSGASTLAPQQLQQAFSRFWESGAPRWGDPGARGWCNSCEHGEEFMSFGEEKEKEEVKEDDEMYDPFDDDEWKKMYEASMEQADSFLETVKAKLDNDKKQQDVEREKEQVEDDEEEESEDDEDDEGEEDENDESMESENSEDEEQEEMEQEERTQMEKDQEDMEALESWHEEEEAWDQSCWHAAAIDGAEEAPEGEDWERFVVAEDVCDGLLVPSSRVAQSALVWAALAALGFVPPRAYTGALCTLPELDTCAPVCTALTTAVTTLAARGTPADPWALTGDWRALCPRVFGFLTPASTAPASTATSFADFGRRALRALADSAPGTAAADRRALLASLLLWEHQHTPDTAAFTAAARDIIARAGSGNAADALPAWHRFAQCLLARGARTAAERVYDATLRAYAHVFAQPTRRVDDLAELLWMAFEHACTLLRTGRSAAAISIVLQCAGVTSAETEANIAPTTVLRARAALAERRRSMRPAGASAAACGMLLEVLAHTGRGAFGAQVTACLRESPAETADIVAVALALARATAPELLAPRQALVLAAHALRASPDHLLVHALVATAGASRLSLLTLLDCCPPAATRTFAAFLGDDSNKNKKNSGLLRVVLEHAAGLEEPPEWFTGDTRLWCLRVHTGATPRRELYAALHGHAWSRALWHAAFDLHGALSAPELRDIARLLVDRGIRVHSPPPTLPPL